jgi:trehalase-like protein
VLREYALLADGECGAVVGPQGDIVWLCAPRWDTDAVFTSLIGGTGEYTAIFMALTFAVFAGYRVFAAAVRRHLIDRPQVIRRVRQAFAASFIALGAKLATTSR